MNLKRNVRKVLLEAMGVPGILLPLVIALEIGGAILVIAGLWTRLTALALAAFTILSALLFHANFAEQMQQIMFLKNLAIAGGFDLISRIGECERHGDFFPDRQFPVCINKNA